MIEMRMKNILRRTITFLLAGILALLAMSVPALADEKPEYLKSVTYAGDGWVINFWSGEMESLDEDMARIAADGFNSIVLVVPWREFSPMKGYYTEYSFTNLDRIMDAAEKYGLWVELRASYRWDYYDASDNGDWYREVLFDSDTLEFWKDYMGKLYEAASAHPNFYGGFITWEDFWNYVEDYLKRADNSDTVSEARRTGYQDYLREHYSLETINSYYDHEFNDYGQIYFPTRPSKAITLFYEFYDSKLMDLLRAGQEVFPDLSMEVRIDMDPYDDGEGNTLWYEHSSTYDCADSSYTSVMYSVSMGFESYKKLTAAEALEKTRGKLSSVYSKNGGKPIYIDQLLYMDETESAAANAKLLPEERPLYLESLAPILRDYTNGYAVWTYRQYRNSPIYNYEFAQGKLGWTFSGNVEIAERAGSMAAHLKAGSTISPKLMGEHPSNRDERDNIVSFTADSDGPVELVVTLGSKSQRVTVDGRENFEINFGQFNYSKLTFRAEGDVYIDNVYLYNFVQEGQIYDYYYNELSCADAVRILNASLN